MAQSRNDDAMMEEVIAQLHDADDRRDAAEMRVEELVRDAEFEPPPEAPERRISRVAIAMIVTAVGAVLWLLARVIPS